MMSQQRILDIISHIEAMRSQEENTKRSHNYFSKSHPVDAGSRKAMADWCTQIADTLSFSRETVGIAMTYLDRYLSSGKGNSLQVLHDRHQFQLAAITSFYVAVKLHEPIIMGIDLLVKMCRGFYSEEEITFMEQDILFALDWRVYGPTPLDFVRHLLELLPESVHPSHATCLLESAEKNMTYATSDVYFSCCKPSVVGVGCIMSALSETNANESLTPTELNEFCMQIATAMGFEQLPLEALEVQQRFLLRPTPLDAVATPKTAVISRTNSVVSTSSMDEGSTSPMCVSQTRVV